MQSSSFARYLLEEIKALPLVMLFLAGKGLAHPHIRPVHRKVGMRHCGRLFKLNARSYGLWEPWVSFANLSTALADLDNHQV